MFSARAMRHMLAHRLDGFGALLWDKNERAAFVTECLPHLAFKILFVLVREEFVAIDEKQKCRRCLARLRGIKELQAMPGSADGLAPLDRVVQGAIENRRRDFLAELRRHIADGFEQAVQVEA